MRSLILAVLKQLIVTSDFKVVEEKFIDQGIEKALIDEYFKDFKKFRDQHRITDNQQKDINYWGKEGWDKFVEFIDKLKGEKSKTEEKKLQKIEGAELFAENKDWYVYRILNHNACRKYGSNTKWCITQEGGTHWKSYSSKNNIYFYIAKSPFKDTLSDNYHKIAAIVDGSGKISYWDAEDHEFYLRDFDKADTLPKDKLEVWENLITINGKKYKVNEIPPNSKIEGDLHIEANSGLTMLPRGLVVDGDIIINYNENFTKIPDLKANSIVIRGKKLEFDSNISAKNLDIHIKQTEDFKIPLFKNVENLEIQNLDKANIIVPENLQIQTLEILYGNIKIPNIEANLISIKNANVEIDEHVDAGKLRLYKCTISKLPIFENIQQVELDGCVIETYNIAPNLRYLDISNTRIVKLGAANLETLIANKTTIKKIDPNFKVSGIMDMRNSKIDKLPDNLSLHKLNLAGSNLKQLPKNLKVNILDISETPMKTLDVPGLEISEKLNIQYTDIEKLPPNISVEMLLGGKSRFKKSKLKELPPFSGEPILDSLDLSESMLESLPPKLVIQDNLILKDMPHLKKLSTVLKVGNILSIVRVPSLKKLPAKLQAKILLTDNRDLEIPKSAKIEHIQYV